MADDAITVHPFAGWDVAALIEARGRQRGAHAALIWAPFDGPVQVWSYAGFAEVVARIAGGLATRGISAGDRVLLHLENCPETVLARFACTWLGAVVEHALCVIDRESGGPAALGGLGVELRPLFTMTELKAAGEA